VKVHALSLISYICFVHLLSTVLFFFIFVRNVNQPYFSNKHCAAITYATMEQAAAAAAAAAERIRIMGKIEALSTNFSTTVETPTEKATYIKLDEMPDPDK